MKHVADMCQGPDHAYLGHFQKPENLKAGHNTMPPVGTGQRFAALKSKLSKRPGVTNPGALAAFIGRKKYGKAKFQKMAAKGRD